MKIHITCYEDLDTWICGKIARQLCENLVALGHRCTIGQQPDGSADVNHHIIYLNYLGGAGGIDTLMVTHIDNALKLARLQKGLTTARAAICMSRESVSTLEALGVDRAKLHYVHMAPDGRAIQRRFVVGLSTRLYPDGRKREADLVKLLNCISPEDFSFKIMGFGWEPIVKNMRQRGFEVEYHQDFDYEKYIGMMAALDYYLYLSGDEGSAAFVDALAAGVKTIVQPQGFHLDANGGITHPFRNFDELRRVFAGIAGEKRARIDSVKSWTWENYARQHVKIWEACLAGTPLPVQDDNTFSGVPSKSRMALKFRLWANVFLQRARMVLNIRKDYECGSTIWEKRRNRSKKAK